MNRTWKLSELDFYVLWTDMTKDVLPDPFLFVSQIKLQDDLEREMIGVRDRLFRVPDMRRILEVAIDPDLSVIVQGTSNGPDDEQVRQVSLLAVRRGSVGYVITQLPGESFWCTAGYTIMECEAVSLADIIVNNLPRADAGRAGEIPLTTYSDSAEREFGVGRSLVIDSFDDSDDRRSARFLRSEVTSKGEIEVVQGRSVFGPRGTSRHHLSWRDLDEDGRYVVTDGRAPRAVSVDPNQFKSMINARIAAVIRVIKDERR